MVRVCVGVYLISSSLRVASSSSCISFFVSSRAVRGRVGVCAGRPRAVSLSVSLASDSASEPRSCSSTSTTSAETENDAIIMQLMHADMHKLRHFRIFVRINRFQAHGMMECLKNMRFYLVKFVCEALLVKFKASGRGLIKMALTRR